MNAEGIREVLQAKVGSVELFAGPADPALTVPADKWHEAALVLRDTVELRFDFLRAISGVDRPQQNEIEVVLHLFSYRHRHAIVLKTRVPRAGGSLPTLSDVWPAAEWHERELWDMFGVTVSGHRDLRRILMPDDWVGYPLLKDYKEPEQYQGIPMRRPEPAAKGGKAS